MKNAVTKMERVKRIMLAGLASLATCLAPASFAEPLPLTAVKPAPSKQEVEAQMLAIEAANSVVAAPELSARIERDLGAIRLAFPATEHIRARPRWEPTSLLVGIEPAVREKVLARTYGHWDAANRAYEIREIDTRMLQSGDLGIVILRFAQAINAPKIANEYAALTGISYAEPDTAAGDGPDICLVQHGSTNIYVFDDASGDCPSGCIEHTYTAYSTEPNNVAPELIQEAKKTDFPSCARWL